MTPTSPPGPRAVRRSSNTSRSSTITSGGTPRWGTSPRRSTNGKTVNPLSTFRGELHKEHEEHDPIHQRRATLQQHQRLRDTGLVTLARRTATESLFGPVPSHAP